MDGKEQERIKAELAVRLFAQPAAVGKAKAVDPSSLVDKLLDVIKAAVK